MKSVIVAAKFKQSFSPGIKVTADFPRGKILHQKNIILTFSSILGGLGGTSIDIQWVQVHVSNSLHPYKHIFKPTAEYVIVLWIHMTETARH